MSAIGIVGFGTVGVFVVLWLVISFSQPSPRRDVLEWLAASCLFLALATLFLNLVLEAESTLARVAFGFLQFLFSAGCVVSLVNTFRAGRGPGKTQVSTTN
ncbi:MAG: hypothetical protein JRS35_03355 [Deltaproteobacteria bacterium]|nr:hypothetical protein [Deltaproteobacteria bacterium]